MSADGLGLHPGDVLLRVHPEDLRTRLRARGKRVPAGVEWGVKVIATVPMDRARFKAWNDAADNAERFRMLQRWKGPDWSRNIARMVSLGTVGLRFAEVAGGRLIMAESVQGLAESGAASVVLADADVVDVPELSDGAGLVTGLHGVQVALLV